MNQRLREFRSRGDYNSAIFWPYKSELKARMIQLVLTKTKDIFVDILRRREKIWVVLFHCVSSLTFTKHWCSGKCRSLTLSNKTWYRVTRISTWNPIRMTKSLLKIATSLTIVLDSSEWLYTAVSTKVVPEKCKSVRDKVDWLCLIAVQGDSATRNEKEGIHVFVLFPSTMLKHLEVHSSNRKTTITHTNFRHCRVSFSPFVRQPFSKQLYKSIKLCLWMIGKPFVLFNLVIKDLQTETSCQQCMQIVFL